MTTCTVAGCDRTTVGRGLCPVHYGRWRRTGVGDRDAIRYRDVHRWSMSPLRNNATPPGPSTNLGPHYRPWSCPPGSDTASIVGELPCWHGDATRAARTYAAIERNDARLDAEADRRFDLVFDGNVWHCRMREMARAAA